MELKEFITETLIQITHGVIEAQEKIKGTGCLINPEGFGMKGDQIKTGYKNEYRQIQKIKMSVAVTVTENKDKRAGIGIANILKAGISAHENDTNSITNRIELEIPMALPVMEDK